MELRQKNDLMKKFSSKVTTLEIELVQAQAQLGLHHDTHDSAEDADGASGGHNSNSDRANNLSNSYEVGAGATNSSSQNSSN